MKACKYCNNEIREEAYYCDQCGKSLEFKINIKIEHEFEKILDYLISNIKKEGEYYQYPYDIENYIILFWNYIDNHSNLKNVARNDKITLYNWKKSFPLNTAYELRNIPKEVRNREFIIKLNEEYVNYKNTLEKQDFNFIFFTNIDKRKIDSNFKNVIEMFELEIIEYDYIESQLINNKTYDKKVMLNNNFHNRIILKSNTKGKDLNFQYGISLDNIYGCLGFISLINNYNKTKKIAHLNSFKGTYELIDFTIISMTVQINNKLMEPKNTLIYKLKYANSSLSKEKIDINEIFIKKYYNSNLKKELNKYLGLYYLASTENDLPNSFLKYWTLSERMIKDCLGKITYDKLNKIMKNILVIEGYPEYVYKQIEYITSKRHAYVHEFNYDLIEQSDRNLAKIISEKLLGFMLLTNVNIQNMEDFINILNYYNQQDKLNKINKLLDELKNEKEN